MVREDIRILMKPLGAAETASMMGLEGMYEMMWEAIDEGVVGPEYPCTPLAALAMPIALLH